MFAAIGESKKAAKEKAAELMALSGHCVSRFIQVAPYFYPLNNPHDTVNIFPSHVASFMAWVGAGPPVALIALCTMYADRRFIRALHPVLTLCLAVPCGLFPSSPPCNISCTSRVIINIPLLIAVWPTPGLISPAITCM